MVDVGGKPVSSREAVAAGAVRVSRSAMTLARAGGDVIDVIKGNDRLIYANVLDAGDTVLGSRAVVASPTANTECSGVTNLLRLKWSETQGTTTTNYVAAYAIQSVSGTYQLKRYYCVNSGAASTHVVGRNLENASAGTVSVSGTRVSMTLTMKDTPTDTSNYTFTVSANRRV